MIEIRVNLLIQSRQTFDCLPGEVRGCPDWNRFYTYGCNICGNAASDEETPK